METILYQNRALFALHRHYPMTGKDPEVIDTITSSAQLAGGDWFRYYYPHVFSEHMSDGCDLFDPEILVRWAYLWQKINVLQFGTAFKAIQSTRTPYLTSEEVNLRMTAADGSCPMCGTVIAFSKKGELIPDLFTRVDMIRCDHFRFKHVSDPEIVRTADAWTGPVSALNGSTNKQ